MVPVYDRPSASLPGHQAHALLGASRERDAARLGARGVGLGFDRTGGPEGRERAAGEAGEDVTETALVIR